LAFDERRAPQHIKLVEHVNCIVTPRDIETRTEHRSCEMTDNGFLKHSQLQGIFWPLAHANRSSISNSCISPQPSTSLGRRRSTNLVSFVLRVRFTISTLKQHANVLNSKLGHRMSRCLSIVLRHRVDLLRLLLLQDFLLPGEFLSPLSRTRLPSQQRPQCLMTTRRER